MAKLITEATTVKAAGNLPKIIQELVGRVNSDSKDISIAKMTSPSGWVEPGQTPEFEEYTFVLRGAVQIETKSGSFEVKPGNIFHAAKGEWIRYSTPGSEGAEYIAICTPAFSLDTVHRDDE